MLFLFFFCLCFDDLLYTETGLNDLAMIYISDNLKLCDDDKNSEINSFLVISMAAFMLVSQLIILPILSILINDIKLILSGVTALLITFLFAILLYFWNTTYVALILYGFHGMSFALIPIFSGALSKRISPKEQGVAMGVIHAVKGIFNLNIYLLYYLYAIYRIKCVHSSNNFWMVILVFLR